MPVFAIYKMMFSKASQRNLLAEDGRTNLDKAQEYLDELLQDKLPIVKRKRDQSVVPLDNYIEARHDGVYLMVVCNEKPIKYKEKMDEMEFVSHPGAYVIIDNREGVAQVAIERSASFNNNTDKVCELLQEAISKAMARFELTVELRPKMREGEFWDVVEEQQERYHDKVQKVSFDFSKMEDERPIDAPKSIVEKLMLFNSITKAINAARGQLNLVSDKGSVIQLQRAQEDFAHLVSMCSHNAYNISVKFERYGLYRFGGTVKALDSIKNEILQEFKTGQMVSGKRIEGEFALLQQMDEIRLRTENYVDAEPVEQKRTRRHS